MELECPICYEIIENTNSVVTECGHKFHTKCLMANVAHNGFSCPCCRASMAEIPEEEDDEDEEEDDWESSDENEIDDYALRGMRWLYQRANGEDLDDEEDEPDEDEPQQEETIPKPSVELITRKLKQQGITMEELVKTLLLQHEEYAREEEEYDQVEDNLFGKIRIIISNYNEAEDASPKPDSSKQTEISVDRFYENRFLTVV